MTAHVMTHHDVYKPAIGAKVGTITYKGITECYFSKSIVELSRIYATFTLHILLHKTNKFIK